MLRVALINGSPKGTKSHSEHIIEEMKYELEGVQIEEIQMPSSSPEGLEKILRCHAAVFVFPLYVDGIPAHFLSCLMEMEQYFKAEQAGFTVYTVVQGGFYESIQAKTAIEIMENWCARTYLKWGQGIAVGGGGMLECLDQKHNYFMQKIEEAIGELCDGIRSLENGPTLYAEPNIPRAAYKMAAERQWRKLLKENGLDKEALFYRIPVSTENR